MTFINPKNKNFAKAVLSNDLCILQSTILHPKVHERCDVQRCVLLEKCGSSSLDFILQAEHSRLLFPHLSCLFRTMHLKSMSIISFAFWMTSSSVTSAVLLTKFLHSQLTLFLTNLPKTGRISIKTGFYSLLD